MSSRSETGNWSTAVSLIGTGATVASAGVIGWVTPDVVLKALGDRFRKTGTPRDLTFYFPCGTGDAMGIKGMDHVGPGTAHEADRIGLLH